MTATPNSNPMKYIKILNGYGKLTDAELEVKAQQIHQGVDGNTSFPNPVPSVADMGAKITAFQTALTNAQQGGTLSIAIKNKVRAELITMLHQWASYVLFCANGDLATVVSSGFSPARPAEPVGPLAKPSTPELTQGANSGEINSKVIRVHGAKSYMHQYTTDAQPTEASWKSILSTSTTCTIKQLQPGTVYYVRVAAIGPREQVVYSDVTSRMAI